MPTQPTHGLITAIESQARSRPHLGKRLNIFIDERFSFALDASLAAQRGLKPGMYLDAATLSELLQEDGTAKAYVRALHFLSYRPRSAEEIRARLERDEWPAQVIDRVLDRLQNEQLLNDANFAALWVENRSITRPRGASLLRHELRQKGVEREIIDAALPDAEQELENAVAAVQSKLRQWNTLDERTRRTKILTFLQRRGFRYTVANGAWLRLQEDHEDMQA